MSVNAPRVIAVCLILISARDAIGQSAASDDDAIGAVYEWASDWADAEAMAVTWNVLRNRYAQDGSILEAAWLVEDTLYRWPDSFRRTVVFDARRNEASGFSVNQYDKALVTEGIAPTGEHVRRFTAFGQADIMHGPEMTRAIQREAVRAPFVLARWVLEFGLLESDFSAVFVQTDLIEAVSPSRGLGFELVPFADGWVLARVTNRGADGTEYARLVLSDFGWPEHLPAPLGRRVSVSVRKPNGEYSPASPMELIAARIVDRPSDAALVIDTSADSVNDRRSVAQQRAAGVAEPREPRSAATPPGRTSLRDMLLGGGIAMVFAGVGWWLWQRRRTV